MDNKQFLKDILAGNVPRQALNPPKFRMHLQDDGYFHFYIGGQEVDKDTFHRERELLYVDDYAFDIDFRNPDCGEN